MRTASTFMRRSSAALAAAAMSTVVATAGAGAAELPDGRGYERVTPNGKQGQTSLRPAGVEDDFIQWVSIPAMEPAESGTGNVFRATRGDGGWAVTSYETPPSPRMYESLASQAFNRELTSYWWNAWSPGDMTSIDLWRRVDGGAPEPVPGGQGVGPVSFVGVSSDGRRALATVGPELVPEDNSSSAPYYVSTYLFDDDGPHLVGVDSNGDQLDSCGDGMPGPQNDDGELTVSDDLETIFIQTAGCDGPPHIYARLGMTTTVDASPSRRSSPDPAGVQPRKFVRGSSDGSKLIFWTAEQLLDGDTDGGSDLYLYDLEEDALTLVSGGPAPGDDVGFLGFTRAANDLSRIYFVGDRALGGEGMNGQPNLYLWAEGSTRFVATLSREGRIPWGPIAGHIFVGSNSRQAQVTPDGNRLAFVSAASLVPEDGDAFDDVYGYDATTDTLRLLSPGDGPHAAVLSSDATGPFTWTAGGVMAVTLSEDGRFGIFETAEPISPQDSNQSTDVYRWRWDDASVRLVSPGNENAVVLAAAISPDGGDIYFGTDQAISPNDTDGVRDFYDARIGGGDVSDPVQRPCRGDSCQGRAADPPSWTEPITDSGFGDDARAAVARPSLSLAAITARQRRLAARSGRIALTVRVNRPGLLRATAMARLAGKRTTVGSSTKRAARAGLVRMPLRLSHAARARLAGGHRLPLRLQVRFAGAAPSQLALDLRASRGGRR